MMKIKLYLMDSSEAHQLTCISCDDMLRHVTQPPKNEDIPNRIFTLYAQWIIYDSQRKWCHNERILQND